MDHDAVTLASQVPAVPDPLTQEPLQHSRPEPTIAVAGFKTPCG
jgi:hypothetical protein